MGHLVAVSVRCFLEGAGMTLNRWDAKPGMFKWKEQELQLSEIAAGEVTVRWRGASGRSLQNGAGRKGWISSRGIWEVMVGFLLKADSPDFAES